MLKRTILARLAASLMLLAWALPTTGEAGAAETVVFRDDGRANWQQLFKKVGLTCATATRAGPSLRITSCPVSGGTGNKTAMVWALTRVSAPGFKVEFDYTHHSATASPGGTMTGLMLLASGDGSTGYPVDVTRWGAQCCAGPPNPATGYALRMRGLQLNFANRFDPRGNNFVRLRGLKGAVGSYEELGAAEIPVADGRAYHVTAVRAGTRVTISFRDNVTGTTRTLAANHPYIGTLGPGWVGIRQMPGRSSNVANLKVSTGG
jgi:hypothetical protein